MSTTHGEHTMEEASIASPGYYPSLSGAEISGADRSGCFPYATFGGVVY